MAVCDCPTSTTTITHHALEPRQTWDGLWGSAFGHWLLIKGLHIVIVAALVATRLIRQVATRISRRLAEGDDADATVHSEAVKHRQAIASVISSVAIAVLYVVVSVDVINAFGLPIGSLVAPAAVLGAALGFGAQRIVQDLLSGFYHHRKAIWLRRSGAAHDCRQQRRRGHGRGRHAPGDQGQDERRRDVHRSQRSDPGPASSSTPVGGCAS